MGRLSTYTPEIAAEILQRLETEPLNQICRDEHLPPESTVRHWVTDDVQGFAAKYAHARGQLIEHMGDEVLSLADTATSENYNAIRLRVDSRKWLLSKLRPQVYGDRTAIEHSGPGGTPIGVTIVNIPGKAE